MTASAGCVDAHPAAAKAAGTLRGCTDNDSVAKLGKATDTLTAAPTVVTSTGTMTSNRPLHGSPSTLPVADWPLCTVTQRDMSSKTRVSGEREYSSAGGSDTDTHGADSAAETETTEPSAGRDTDEHTAEHPHTANNTARKDRDTVAVTRTATAGTAAATE